MEIKLTISADESALEFARLIGNAVNEITVTPKVETIEPDPIKVVTLEECRAKASEVMGEDPDKFRSALVKFQVKKVPDLKPDQYAAFMEFLS